MLDANRNPVPTYTQAVVTNMAKVLTGWTYPDRARSHGEDQQPGVLLRPDVRGGSRARHQREDDFRQHHDSRRADRAKQDLESLLDALMQQPTMAPFVCQQLIQHLVTSNPSPAYMQRVAEVFRK